MNKQKIGILAAAVCGMAGTFLPWVTAPLLGSLNGTEGDTGWYTFGLFGVAAAAVLPGGLHGPMNRARQAVASVPAVAAGALGAWKIAGFLKLMSQAAKNNPFGAAFGPKISLGIGLYVIVGAAVAAAGAAFLLKDTQRSYNL